MHHEGPSMYITPHRGLRLRLARLTRPGASCGTVRTVYGTRTRVCRLQEEICMHVRPRIHRAVEA